MQLTLILFPLFILLLLNLPFGSVLRKSAFWISLILVTLQIGLVIFEPIEFWAALPAESLRLPFIFNFMIDRLSLLMLLAIGLVAWIALVVGNSLIPATSDDPKHPEHNDKFNFFNLVILIQPDYGGRLKNLQFILAVLNDIINTVFYFRAYHAKIFRWYIS